MISMYVHMFGTYFQLSPWIFSSFSLVGGWTNPFQKYARQIGSWNPRDRDENKKNTPQKINMEPGNDDFQVRNLLFQGAPISGEPCLFWGVQLSCHIPWNWLFNRDPSIGLL